MRYKCEKVGVEFFEEASTRYCASVEIAASPDQVFDAFLDADAWTRWAWPITAVEWTSEFPIEVGSTRTVRMRGGLIGYEEFIAYEHGVRMAFRFDEASTKGIEAFAEDYRVTDLGAGRCRVDWTMAMKNARQPRFVSAATDPIMGFMVRRMLGKFGRLVESTKIGTK
ncbi:MAG: SRPBCC family protein [Mycobacterium sp.]